MEIGIKISSYESGSALRSRDDFQTLVITFLPTTMVLPSADHERVNASPPTSSLLTHVLDRTSQKRTVPSAEQLASSASRTGLNRTSSTAAECPRSSVEYRTAGRSGFQMRRVRSAEPVAISCPAGFHAKVRRLQLHEQTIYKAGRHRTQLTCVNQGLSQQDHGSSGS